MNKIVDKANYCLNCKMKPCSVKGCPIQTKIPEFINEIKNENYLKAYDILQENNICSHICSIVCPQEEQCEGSCVRGIKSNPTEIGELEKFVNDYAESNSYQYDVIVKEKNGKKIAIIGSGPAGIECAYELVKEGFEVDIYEKDKIPGGILVYGIPDFRLSKDKVEDVFNKLKSLGVRIFLEKEVGKDILFEDIEKKYDSIFVGIGASKSIVYSLSDNEKANENIYKSDVFLKAYSEKNFIKNLGTVAVIGGGNVAMDCARTALKMGAEKVKILYRRDREHMPAREVELDEAIEDGVEFKELVRVESANLDKNNVIKFLNCKKTEIVDGKAQDIPDRDSYLEDANTVVFAIGLKPEKSIFEKMDIELDEWGYVKLDDHGMTNLKNVYAGGDDAESKATVCRALAAGKKAALGIIENLK